jgi:tRNA dimethylallyltransferase
MPIDNNRKIIAVLGTTASGKTSLAVKLAYEFCGEVVSADSRQVYKHMDVGSGKDLDEYNLKIKKIENKKTGIENHKIPYHCIDLVDPKTEYNLAKYYKDASRAIIDILNRDKLPIIAGGTGLYAQALIDGYELSDAKPDKKLREELEDKSASEVFDILIKLDKNCAETLSNSEKNNKRRLIRRIEIINSGSGKTRMEPLANADHLLLGLTWPKEVLKARIEKRINDRIKNQAMIEEVERLRKEHRVSWKRLESFGLEYKYISLYLRGILSLDEAISQLSIATAQFAKRQMNWLRRWEKQGRKINWVDSEKKAILLVRDFIE